MQLGLSPAEKMSVVIFSIIKDKMNLFWRAKLINGFEVASNHWLTNLS